MKLYFAPRSRAVRTAWLLYELGLDFEIERLTIGDKAMRSGPFLSLNPNGRVPVLCDGSTRISESTAIAQYLVARYGAGRGLAPDVAAPAFPDYLQWLHYAEGMLMGPISNYVVETRLLPPERRSEPHAKRALKLLGRLLAPVDARLKDRDHLAGAFSVADTVTGHACLVARDFGAETAGLDNLTAYLARLTARPALQKALAL